MQQTIIESAEGRTERWRMARTRGVGLFRVPSAPIRMACRNKQVLVLRRGVEHEGVYFQILHLRGYL